MRLLFACIPCFVRAYPDRALGLTSQNPKSCLECGADAIGVMVDCETYRGQVRHAADMGPPGDDEPRAKNQGHPVKPKQGRLF